MKPTLTLKQVKALKPCAESFQRVSKLLEKGKAFDVASARAAGCTLDDLIWVASKAARTDKDIERRLRLWMADCAAHVLSIYEKTGKSDAPRKAIIAARQLARDEISTTADTAWATARAAARAAADTAWAAARAAAWAAADTADAAGAAESDWQFDRLVAWFSDNEPEEWPLEATNG